MNLHVEEVIEQEEYSFELFVVGRLSSKDKFPLLVHKIEGYQRLYRHRLHKKLSDSMFI